MVLRGMARAGASASASASAASAAEAREWGLLCDGSVLLRAVVQSVPSLCPCLLDRRFYSGEASNEAAR